ncbi:MAG: hypothetical protein WCA37_05155 [Terracidiphilus sp.]
MESDLESKASSQGDGSGQRPADWLKMAALAAASAAAGGLAAAWFYRKTLTRLREAADSSATLEAEHPPEADDSDDL